MLVEHDELCEEDLSRLYDVFLDKIKNTVYQTRLSTQEKTLTDNRNVFCELSKEDKCVVLSEILHMFQCQSGAANLKLMNGPANAGILLLNKVISKCNQIAIIHQSPTGIYEQEIDLKKI